MADKILGQFYSTCNYDEVVMPKKFDGYKTPAGQAVTENGQKLVFVYEPIVYNVSYELDGGYFYQPDEDISANAALKHTYTIEDNYTPPTPTKPGHTFKKWNPESITAGMFGDLTFTASWEANSILAPGHVFREDLLKLSANVDIASEAMAIYTSNTPPNDISACIDVSNTSSPIYAWYLAESKAILLYSEKPIYYNSNMKGALQDFTNLRNINAFANFNPVANMDITDMCNGCTLLSYTDAFVNLGDYVSTFTRAFLGTAALSAGRVPSWYRMNVKIRYYSSNGNLIESVYEDRIPGEVVYPKAIDHYTPKTASITITEDTTTYNIVYDPIKYNITYVLSGGVMAGGKTTYTIDDETYILPQPTKEGYTFIGWTPEGYINKGSYGNKVFTAQYQAQ